MGAPDRLGTKSSIRRLPRGTFGCPIERSGKYPEISRLSFPVGAGIEDTIHFESRCRRLFFLRRRDRCADARAHDWNATPLGPPETWPQSLKTVVNILLTSRFQMWMAWGEELSFFYNDAYRPTLGIKLATALGTSAPKVWKKIAHDIGPRIDRVLATGEATWDEGLLLLLERSGYPEETYHTFSYSPLSDDDGRRAGIFCVVTEETERIIGERRLSTLRELASRISGKNTREEVCLAIAESLQTNRRDLPFTLTYLLDESGNANLFCSSGVSAGDAIAPAKIGSDGINAIWPLGDALEARAPITVGDLSRISRRYRPAHGTCRRAKPRSRPLPDKATARRSDS